MFTLLNILHKQGSRFGEFLKLLASIPNPFNTRSSENDPQEILQFLNKFYHRCLGRKKHPSRGTKSEMLAAKGAKVGVSSAYLDKFANKIRYQGNHEN